MHWQPAHKAHAIERVSLTLQFAEAVSAKPWQALLNAATLRIPKSGFNTTVENRGLQFPPFLQNMPMAGFFNLQVAEGNANPLLGRSFQANDASGLKEQATFNKSNFSYQVSFYDSWDFFKAKFFDLFEESLEIAMSLTNISVIKLEYWDRFVNNDNSPVIYSDILNKDSVYMAKSPIGQEDLWHSHVGYYALAVPGTKRLINVNVDVLDLADSTVGQDSTPILRSKRSVGIYTMAQDTLSPDNAPDRPGDLASTFDDLHTILKTTLADVITQEASDRISLNPQGAP